MPAAGLIACDAALRPAMDYVFGASFVCQVILYPSIYMYVYVYICFRLRINPINICIYILCRPAMDYVFGASFVCQVILYPYIYMYIYVFPVKD